MCKSPVGAWWGDDPSRHCKGHTRAHRDRRRYMRAFGEWVSDMYHAVVWYVAYYNWEMQAMASVGRGKR